MSETVGGSRSDSLCQSSTTATTKYFNLTQILRLRSSLKKTKDPLALRILLPVNSDEFGYIEALCPNDNMQIAQDSFKIEQPATDIRPELTPTKYILNKMAQIQSLNPQYAKSLGKRLNKSVYPRALHSRLFSVHRFANEQSTISIGRIEFSETRLEESTKRVSEKSGSAAEPSSTYPGPLFSPEEDDEGEGDELAPLKLGGLSKSVARSYSLMHDNISGGDIVKLGIPVITTTAESVEAKLQVAEVDVSQQNYKASEDDDDDIDLAAARSLIVINGAEKAPSPAEKAPPKAEPVAPPTAQDYSPIDKYFSKLRPDQYSMPNARILAPNASALDMHLSALSAIMERGACNSNPFSSLFAGFVPLAYLERQNGRQLDQTATIRSLFRRLVSNVSSCQIICQCRRSNWLRSL